MMPNWNDMHVAEEHRRDLLRAADLDQRLAQAKLHGPRPQRRVYAAIMANLGRLMARWGAQLQATYERA